MLSAIPHYKALCAHCAAAGHFQRPTMEVSHRTTKARSQMLILVQGVKKTGTPIDLPTLVRRCSTHHSLFHLIATAPVAAHEISPAPASISASVSLYAAVGVALVKSSRVEESLLSALMDSVATGLKVSSICLDTFRNQSRSSTLRFERVPLLFCRILLPA